MTFKILLSVKLHAFRSRILLETQVPSRLETISRSDSEDLVRMKYLTACVKESLMLYGCVPSITRTTSEDMEIEGHLVPAKTEICLNLAMLHRDPNYFLDPEKFDPERFLADMSI